MEFSHLPVMPNECMNALRIRPDGVYVDGTLGGGGHSSLILKNLSENGTLYAFDKDRDALEFCSEKFRNEKRIHLIHADFKKGAELLRAQGITEVDGVFLDLGVSSHQLDTFERGFSYRSRDAKLDMRMDQSQTKSAYDVVNGYTAEILTEIFTKYGEEPFAKRIAENILNERKKHAVETTGQLVNIIDRSIPEAAKIGKGHCAKRTFQAIRIEVNGELDGLDEAVKNWTDLLRKGGRIAILTFHSLEDRIVKQTMKESATDCICPKNLPVCVCQHKKSIRILTTKPMLPSEKELNENSRSASAKLRAAEKL